MKKIIFLICFLIISTNSFSQFTDSLEIEKLSDEIQRIKQENKDLTLKVTIFNDANNKIITATYALLALIFAIGIWNTIQSYIINNQKLKVIEENIYNKVKIQNTEMLQKLNLENQSIINSYVNSSKKEILENKILLAKMCCQSIDSRVYKDINTELFKLDTLLTLSIKLSEISIDKDELKESLNHIINYFKKYPVSGYEEYEINLIRNTINSIPNNDFLDLKELILELTNKK